MNFFVNLDVKWQYRVPKVSNENEMGDWADMNTTYHMVYTTLDNKVAGTVVYPELLEFTCTWAANETDQDGTFSDIWSHIASQGTGYKYYGTGSLSVGDARLLMVYGNGDCDSWADFMVDCCKVHGISSVSNNHFYPSSGYQKIIVKNVTYGTQYLSGPPRKTFFDDNSPVSGIFGMSFSSTGIPGQGVETPAYKEFNYHAVVFKTGSSLYQDPSYMTTWISGPNFRSNLAGQRKSETVDWLGNTYYNIKVVTEPPY